MRTRYIIATGLIIIGFIIHSIGGELTDIKFLVLTDIADNIKIEIRAVWYLVSIDFFVSAIFLILIQVKNTISQNKLLIDFIGIRMFVYGIMFLLLILFSNSKLLFQVPQWILLISIGTLLEWNKIIKLFKK